MQVFAGANVIDDVTHRGAPSGTLRAWTSTTAARGGERRQRRSATVPELDGVEADSVASGDLDADGIDAERVLELLLGRLGLTSRLAGARRAGSLVTLDGSGDADLARPGLTRRATLDVSGSGDLDVRAAGRLDGRSSTSSGDVRYLRRARRVTPDVVDGSGDLSAGTA